MEINIMWMAAVPCTNHHQ